MINQTDRLKKIDEAMKKERVAFERVRTCQELLKDARLKYNAARAELHEISLM
jgi:hypothetical protein